MKINRKLLTAMAMVMTICGMASAQSSEMSPYSKFGYGILGDNATSAQKQMGGVGYAMRSGRQINVMNPASYAGIDSLTFLFDMGVDFSIMNSSDKGASKKQYGGGLDYITMQFPITKYIGASIGLVPYSSVGYSFGSDITNGTTSRLGSGGLNQLYGGISFLPFKKFTIGANISYLWGSIVNDVYANTSLGSISLFEQVIDVRDYNITVGAQYSIDFSSKDRVTLGVVYSPKKTMLGHGWVTKYDTSADVSSNGTDMTITADTLAYESLKGKFSRPETWGAGISYEHNRQLLVEADITYQPWKNAKFAEIANFAPTKFANRWQAGVGLQYQPRPRGNYLQRITYRIGGFYNRDYIMVGDNNVRDYGISCGFGLPAPAGKTIINLGFEYRHRQAYPTPLLKENYFNITLGVNFNELWFMKSKIY